MSEDILNGACCEICGVYFVGVHGYPCTCIDCWEMLTDDEQTERIPAYMETL